jgi:hypothetical protein
MDEIYDMPYSYAIDPDFTLEYMLQRQDEQQLLSHFAIPLSVQAYNAKHIESIGACT